LHDIFRKRKREAIITSNINAMSKVLPHDEADDSLPQGFKTYDSSLCVVIAESIPHIHRMYVSGGVAGNGQGVVFWHVAAL
jgi:hypothetical protein